MNTTESPKPSMEDIKQYLRTNLCLDVVTRSNYVGAMGGGSCYIDSNRIILMLDGEVISSIDI